MVIVKRDLKISEAIQRELEIDAQLIIRGFQELQNLDAEHGVYFLASQSLSQGLERMMKVILFLNGIQIGELKHTRHNLEILWERVKAVKYCDQINDDILNKELKILSEFNKNARYHYLSIMDGEEITFDPQKEWEILEDEQLYKVPSCYKKLANGDDANNVIRLINCCHIIPLEKIVCTLSRAIVKYQVPEVGWIVPLVFREFARYNESSYGKTDYSTWPNCLEHKDKPQKSWIDTCLNIWSNIIGMQCEKSQIVYKSENSSQWPFRDIQKVIVIRRENKYDTFYFISINGHLCALNGETADKLNLPTPHKAGYAVSGYSTQPFLEIARNL